MKINKGIFYAVVAAIIWSTGGVFIKLVDAPAFYIAMVRSLIAFLTFLPFLRLREIRWTKNLFFLLISYSYTLISFVVATKLTTAANAIMLQYTAPVWLFLFYFLIKKQINKRKVFPILLVVIGIILFLFEGRAGSNALGNIIALSSSIAFAGVAYFSSKDHGTKGASLISLCNLATFLLAIPFAKNIIQITLNLRTTDIIGLILLGSIQIAVGYLFYIKALKFISPLDVSLIGLLEPLFNPIWVFFFIREVPTIIALIGSFFILSGIVINLFLDRKYKTQ
ncbi:MAG: EamA family transporter [Clostridiales bacterium]|nr:EamA family transporter [Clostridiales bacterium]